MAITRWEYRTELVDWDTGFIAGFGKGSVAVASDYKTELVNLGDKGWELVAITDSSGGAHREFFFKRPQGSGLPR